MKTITHGYSQNYYYCLEYLVVFLLHRIVAEGGLKDCVVPDSVKVFRFDLEYSLLEEQVRICALVYGCL